MELNLRRNKLLSLCVLVIIIIINSSQMDIQFIVEQQSLETLCFHYILNQTPKSKTLLVNSILMHLASNPGLTLFQLFKICSSIVDENRSSVPGASKTMTDKEYYKNMAVLLKDIVGKYPGIVPMTKIEELKQIVGFCCKEALCAVAGNDFIATITLILQKMKQNSKEIETLTESMIMDPKMHIGSYRQATRNHLYSILYKILLGKTSVDLNVDYIKKIIRSIEDEKDPRNILVVFQIFLFILNNSSNEHLQGVKKKIFDCLEMYYPIDFEGDADKHSIKLNDIKSLLDQCLTHPVFTQQLRALLMIKMGAAPVGKYISTFIGTRDHPVTADSISFWCNLLARTSEQQYIQEEYSQESEHTLSNLITQLLNRLVPKVNPIPFTIYSSILSWLNSFISKQILNCQDNSKNANLIIVTLKDIMKKCHSEVRHLVAAYTVYSFVECCKFKEKVGDIVYKLGILVPILEYQYGNIDGEQSGLLILSLTQIFHTSEQPQPKLIVLKLFMLLSKCPRLDKMVTQTNILQSCLIKISEGKEDSKITKAYTDFVVQMYGSDVKVRECIVNCEKMEVKIYGLLTLAMKVSDCYGIVDKMLLKSNPNYEQAFKQFVNNIRVFKPEPVFQILSNLDLELNQSESQQIVKIIDEKISYLQIQSEESIISFINKYIKKNIMLFLCRNVWRPYLVNQKVSRILKDLILQWIEKKINDYYLIRTMAYFNKSLQAFNKKEQIIHIQSIENSETYHKEIYCMLPIVKGHDYSNEECYQWPTLVHFCWINAKQIRIDLIQHLPTSILAHESGKILPIVIAREDACTLAKILSSVPEEVIVSQIIGFVVSGLQKANGNTDVERVVSLNKILLSLEQRSKEQQEINRALMKNKGRILVAIQQNLLQHKKRRARQSSRTIFSLYNSLK